MQDDAIFNLVMPTLNEAAEKLNSILNSVELFGLTIEDKKLLHSVVSLCRQQTLNDGAFVMCDWDELAPRIRELQKSITCSAAIPGCDLKPIGLNALTRKRRRAVITVAASLVETAMLMREAAAIVKSESRYSSVITPVLAVGILVLGGGTMYMESWRIAVAILAGILVLGIAMFMSSGKKKHEWAPLQQAMQHLVQAEYALGTLKCMTQSVETVETR